MLMPVFIIISVVYVFKIFLLVLSEPVPGVTEGGDSRKITILQSLFRTMLLKLKYCFMMQRLGRRLYSCLMYYIA